MGDECKENDMAPVAVASIVDGKIITDSNLASGDELSKDSILTDKSDTRKRAHSTDSEEDDVKKAKVYEVISLSDDETDKLETSERPDSVGDNGMSEMSENREESESPEKNETIVDPNVTPKPNRKRAPKTPRSAGTTPKVSKEEREKERERRLQEKQKQKEEREHMIEQKRLEKEKLTREKEEKRKEEERKKEEKRKEEEERKRKREEEKEKKRKEEEEKKDAKRREEEEKKEKKRKEEDDRLAKKKEEDEKKEAKRKEEQAAREAEEAKKRRESNRFKSFFKVEKKPVAPVVIEKEKSATWYLPFPMKPGMSLAPITRRDPLSDESDILQQQEEPTGYLKSIHNIKLDGLEKNDMRAKLFQFHDNYRPPYWGTWRRTVKGISAKNPWKKEETVNYEVESDLEWEDEPSDAEECRSDDEDNEEGAENEDDEDNEGFFVEPGYLSDGEGETNDCSGEPGSELDAKASSIGGAAGCASESAEVRAARLASRARDWEQRVNKKKKISKIVKPTVLGPCYSHPPQPCQLLPVVMF